MRFLETLADDDRRGALRSLAEYQARFPGAPEIVAREWSRWMADRERDASAFGPYRLEAILGRGGQGVVYQALDVRLGRRVALKVLHAPEWTRPGTVPTDGPPRLLAREVEALTRLEHPNIAQVYAAGVEQGQAFIAMRLVQGLSLKQQLAEWNATSAPPLIERLQLGLNLAKALGAAHASDVIHRDIKPGNVLLDPSGQPVLIDFGLARALDSAFELTRTGEQLGTPRYMSPEALLGQGQNDPRSDVWSLGVLLYELVTLQAPFSGQTFESVARRIESSAMPRLTLAGFARRRDLEALLQRCLEKSRAKRYADAGVLADELQLLLENQPIQARPLTPLGRAKRWAARHPAQATILMLLVVLAAGTTWAAIRLNQAAQSEREARNLATMNLARSEADRAHLLLQGTTPDRLTRARAHLQDAILPNEAEIPVQLRSDWAQVLIGVDLELMQTLALGGLGVVKVSPDGRWVAAQAMVPLKGTLDLDLIALDADKALDPNSTEGFPQTLPGNLLAIGAEHFALARDAQLWIHSIDGAPPIQLAVPTLDPAPEAPGERFLDAAFDSSGRFLLAAQTRTWSLHRTSDWAAIAQGTADVALGGVTSFSPSGSWLGVRQSETQTFLLKEGRNPVKIDWPHPVIQIMPLDSDDPACLLVYARPDGLEVGVWRATPRAGQSNRYRTLTRMRGARLPVPKLSLSDSWLAVASEQELVLIELQSETVVHRSAVQPGSALETLHLANPKASSEITDLELSLHQRGAAFKRFRATQSLSWKHRLDNIAEPLPQTAALHVQRRATPAIPQAGFPLFDVQFKGDAPLELAREGELLLQGNAESFLTTAETPNDTWGAALLTLIEPTAIQSYVHVWQRGTPTPWLAFPIENKVGEGALCLSPDARYLAIATVPSRLQLWDLHTRAALLDLSVDLGRVRTLAFDDQGDLRVTAGEQTWRLALGELNAALEQHGLGWRD